MLLLVLPVDAGNVDQGVAVMASSQRKVVVGQPGEDGRSNVTDLERDLERRAVGSFTAKERKKVHSRIHKTKFASDAWEVSGNVIPLLRKKLQALPEVGNEVDLFELGTPEIAVRYFVNDDSISSEILELYEGIFGENYTRFINQDIISGLIGQERSPSDFSPSEITAALFAEEMRERFLAELRPSVEERFFENFAYQFPTASIMMGSIWDNYRHKIRGIAEEGARKDLKYSHFIFHDDDVDSIKADFSENGVRSIPGQAQKILERPEREFIQARHDVIRATLNDVVARYDQLAEITKVSLSDRPWQSPNQYDVHRRLFFKKRKERALADSGSMRAFVEQLRDAHDRDANEGEKGSPSDRWRAPKVGWLERFKTPLASTFFDFCKHRNINARQLAHCVGTIAHYDECRIVRICESVAAALPQDGEQSVRQWHSAFLTMVDDRAVEPSRFIRNWQAIFGAEPECTAEELAELQDNIIAMLALDYCFRHVFSEDGNSGGILDDVSDAEAIVSSMQNAVKRLRDREVDTIAADQKYDETVNVALGLSRHMRDALTERLVLEINDDKKVSKILKIFDNSRIMGVLSLCVFGGFIRDKEHNERVGFVRNLLEQSLQPVFDEVGIAKRDRSELLEDFTKRLLAMHLEGGEKPALESWVNRVVPGLPESAPAFWKHDKQKGDTPVSFIQRHYAPWLGKGLSRADIRRLDPILDRGIQNWLRNYDYPEGFDLPTAKQINDRAIESLQKGAVVDDPDALQRLGAAARYRKITNTR